MLKHYHLKTFGCQMNKHDSERIAGLLQHHGMQPVTDIHDADVIVFMTCCVREKAEERLYGQVSSLKTLTSPSGDPPLIAVGGCIGQRDGEKLIARIPHIDVVFGTHNIAHLPALLDAAQSAREPQVEVLSENLDDESFASAHASESTFHAWLPIITGCDNYCSYCIVPAVRGPEKSHDFDLVVDRAKQLVEQGFKEITLLGQNVNSYGRDRYGRPRFAELLDAVSQTGISRLGFATSHPKDLGKETIAVMASNPNVLRYLHLPMQSGSTRILEAMNRHYTKDEYLSLVDSVYDALPGIALSTDIIVGFPSETEADFEDTLEVVSSARFSSAFTFLYSKREGTPAESMPGQVEPACAQHRFDRLVEAVQEQAYRFSTQLVGTVASVLIEGPSKRDAEVLVGRDRHYRVVHLNVPQHSCPDEWVGTEVDATVTDAHTWYVNAEMPAIPLPLHDSKGTDGSRQKKKPALHG